jgi:hypothetical protein
MLTHSASGKFEEAEIRYSKHWSPLLIKQARAVLLSPSRAAGIWAQLQHQCLGRYGVCCVCCVLRLMYRLPACGAEGCRLKNQAELWYFAAKVRKFSFEVGSDLGVKSQKLVLSQNHFKNRFEVTNLGVRKGNVVQKNVTLIVPPQTRNEFCPSWTCY